MFFWGKKKTLDNRKLSNAFLFNTWKAPKLKLARAIFGCESLLIDEPVLETCSGRADFLVCDDTDGWTGLGLVGCCRTSDFESISNQFPSPTDSTTSGIFSSPLISSLFLGFDFLVTICAWPTHLPHETQYPRHLYGNRRSELPTFLSLMDEECHTSTNHFCTIG